MAEIKTKRTKASVDDFIQEVTDDARRQDCLALIDVMRRVTATEPEMWGPAIVGFGSYHYRYASGREADWFLVGFAPRKSNLTLYIMAGFAAYQHLLSGLGTYKTGKSCLYIKRLADVDLEALEELVSASVAHMKQAHG